MGTLYLILYIVAGFLFLLDAFSSSERTNRYTIRLLPLGLLVLTLVLIIRQAKAL